MIVNVLTDGATTVEIIQDNLPNVVEVFESAIPDVVEIITAGPQGPVGPVGPVGPAGPVADIGSFAITGSNIFKGNQIISGSLVVTQGVSSSFSGSGANLYDIPATAIVGLNLSQITSGSVSASISEQDGLQVNTNVTATSFSGSFSGSGANLSGIPASGITGLNLSQISSGSVSASISEQNGLQVNTNITAPSFTGSLFGTASNSTSASYALSSSYSNTSTSSSYALNSTSASYALTSSYSNNSTSASYSLNSTSASYALTASNILGGKATHLPFFITDTTLATSSLYQSGSTSIIINQDDNTTANPEALYVWQPHPTSINVISGKGELDNYLQLNIQNTGIGSNASSDIVATANNGSEEDNYIDMGINSQNFNGFLGGPNDSYLYSHGHDMWIGNTNDGYDLKFFNSSSHQPIITLTSEGQANITGSLYGTASWALNSLQANNATQATSASYALQADNANTAGTANIALNGGVTNITPGTGITLLNNAGTGNVTIIAGAGTGEVLVISGSNVTGSFVSATSYTFNHNLGVRTPIIQVFDTNYNQVIPQSIELISTSSVTITFPTQESGFAVASVGGVTGNAVSSSYSLFSTYAASASYFVETDPIFTAKSGSYATTGSNRFIGSQTITGSLIVSSSNSITVIGPMTITGSLLVSGSTTQIGNNTLIGNTSLTGSIVVSGSQTFIGNNILTGSFSVTGSTLQTGNNTLIGNTVLSGSLEVSGSQTFRGDNKLVGITTIAGSFSVSGSTTNIIIGDTDVRGHFNVTGSSTFRNSTFTVTGSQFFTGSSFINGSQTLTGNSIVSGTLDVLGNINVISGSAFTRWGNKLFNYGAFSDYTTQSGSANTAHPVTFNTTDVSLEIYLSGSSPIKIENKGIYNFQWSGQLHQGANSSIVSVWIRINGTDVPGSRGDITLSSNSDALPAWNYVLPFNANDAIELYWSSTSANSTWVFSPIQTNPPRPSTASILATLTQIA